MCFGKDWRKQKVPSAVSAGGTFVEKAGSKVHVLEIELLEHRGQSTMAAPDRAALPSTKAWGASTGGIRPMAAALSRER